jgi:ribosomal protein S18 acetylase RimI-like enzyme
MPVKEPVEKMSDQGIQISSMQVPHLESVAEIHAHALEGDFLPSLGVKFLTVFYQAALGNDMAIGIVALTGDTPIGFVLGSLDMDILFQKVVRNASLQLARAALPAVVRKPGLLLKVAESFLYPRREASLDVKAELVVIAVEPEYRSQGLGQTLVNALNAEFGDRNIRSYKVTVLQSNQGANRFYARLGFQNTGKFKLYRQMWNLYIYSLAEANP